MSKIDWVTAESSSRTVVNPASERQLGTTTLSRQRCAVLVGDVAGYTKLMERDESETHVRLAALRQRKLDPVIEQHGGRVVKNTGDGFVAAFADAVQAGRCAIKIQQEALSAAAMFPADEQILFRIGLNFCDVIPDADDIFGEGVNIASRLMAFAEPGDIILTASAADAAADLYQALPTFDTGDLYLKHMSRPVRALGVRIGTAGQLQAPSLLGAADERPSIAILPFRSSSSSQSATCVADSIAEEITHALASVKELFVVSRASTMNRELDDLGMADIGERLGVRYVLQGSVAADTDRTRVFTELTEASTGHVVYAGRHITPTTDLRAIETEIAISATRSIAPNIRDCELRRATRKHPESLTAYDLVLQARQHLYKLSPESTARARGLLQQALALDSQYALAHSCLAYWYILRVGEALSIDPAKDAVDAARSARIAIQLDERDALARSIYGHLQSYLFGDYETASLHFERAIEDGPNCAEAWSLSSLTLGFMGDGEGAIERASYGLRLSPLDGHLFSKLSALAQAYYIAGHYDAAVSWARKARAHNPAALFNERLLAASLVASGRLGEAHRVAAAMRLLAPEFRLDIYKSRCPFRGDVLDAWIDNLRQAGLPD